MRYLILPMTVLAAALLTGAPEPSNVTYIDHAKVAAALANGRTLLDAPDLIVQGAHRAVPGQVEVHEKETDVLYMMDGEATLVTGGTMLGGKLTKPGQYRGKSIEGGQIHHMKKGDVIVIPAKTPHWFKEVSPAISYFVVKVVKP